MFHRPPQLRPDGLKLYIVDITLGTFAPKRLLKRFVKIADGVISLDKKNISWNVLGHDFLSNELCVLLCVGFFYSRALALDKTQIQPQTMGDPQFIKYLPPHPVNITHWICILYPVLCISTQHVYMLNLNSSSQ